MAMLNNQKVCVCVVGWWFLPNIVNICLNKSSTIALNMNRSKAKAERHMQY